MTMRSVLGFLSGRGGRAAILVLASVLFLALTFRVNAVKSDVHSLERRIVQVERERLLLETEFETRASQRQLSDWNEIDFGYLAPTGDQYVDGEPQLAAFGSPSPRNSPEPIRLARGNPLPASEGALAELARVLDNEALDRGRLEFGRAVAMLDGGDTEPASDESLPFNADTARLAQRLTQGTGAQGALGTRLVRSGR